MPPETRYAKKGETSIAYQVVGEGSVDVVFVNGVVSHMALFWSDPAANAMFRRLTSFSRLVLFDKPGTGLSDPIAGPPTLEQRVEDVRVVMDAAGLEKAAIIGFSEGGFPASLFAASHPERCQALVLLETAAKWVSEPDYLPESRAALDRMWEVLFAGAEQWGEGKVIAAWAPSATAVPGFWQAAGSAERLCASPGMARAVLRASRLMDARAALPQISVPTLVAHNERSFVPVELGRYLAAEIEGARLAVFPGEDHLIWFGEWEPIVDEIEELLTGARPAPETDRVLATVLFTDIVGSTERASELGDRAWRDLLEQHRVLVRRELGDHRGREVDTAGDGFMATFDGPAQAIRCASAIIDGTRALRLEVRAGVHTGECVRMGADLAGIGVHIAARVSAAAAPGEVLVSSTVRELVLGSGLKFSEGRTHVLKGVPGEWSLYGVIGDGRTDARPVSEVDPETAALTPGPRETMRPRDRAFLAAADRAPGLVRAFNSATRRVSRGRRMRRANAP